ncbi:MAG TPA: hypothetical protein VKD24_05585 [Candidatus Angelobacter sp.]|nr:hypothetical protein [Candidatus Angelobacter sp.]
MGVLRRLDRRGDTETAWDEKDRASLTKALRLFEEHIKLGGMAYEIEKPREPAEVIRHFNPLAKEIILAPRMVGG